MCKCATPFVFGHLVLSVDPFINTISPAYTQKFILASPLRPIDKIVERGNSCMDCKPNTVLSSRALIIREVNGLELCISFG